MMKGSLAGAFCPMSLLGEEEKPRRPNLLYILKKTKDPWGEIAWPFVFQDAVPDALT